MINLRASFAIALLLACCASAAPRRDVLSHASEGRYWVVHVLAPNPSFNYERSAIRVRDANSAEWQLVSILRGRAVGVAHQANNLAILMQDGSWMLAWPGGTSTGPRLPDSATIHALGSDVRSLWAVGIPSANGASTERPSTLKALVTYEFESGTWQARDALPEAIALDRPLDVAVFDGHPMIAYLASPREIWFSRLQREGGWSAIERIETEFDIADFRIFDRTPTPTLWLAPEGRAGELRPRRADWGPATVLPDGKLPDGAIHRAAEYFAGNVRIVALHEGRLLEQSFTLDGAAPGDPVDLGRTPAPRAAPISGWSMVLMAASAMLLSAAVFRQEEDEPLEFGKERRVLAPLPRRAMAGLIDFAPLLVMMIWTIPWGEEKSIDGAMTSEQVVIRSLVAMAIYLAHTTLLEMTIGRSIGKLICRLRVVNLEGEPPAKSALLIRNIVRIVDVLPALPLAILILFSPLRQRLGDVLARTIVVSDAPASDKREAQ